MSGDWDFFSLLVDDEPASIYVDLGLAREAPLPGRSHMAYVRVLMRQPRPDGLSSNEEFDTLIAIEDALVAQVVQHGPTTFAGRNTSSGNRDFYFYTADPDGFDGLVAAAMARHPDYDFETGTRHDPDWDVYFDFLSPSPDDFQRIMNRRVVENLAAHGDDRSKPRDVDHFAYLPDAAALGRLRGYLESHGFDIGEPRLDDGAIALAFKRQDRPDAMDEVVIPLARHIRDLGGEYDGWGCEVVA